MRRIAQICGIRYESDARIFYKQARFMEDFEDDFDFRGIFKRYFPTYQTMDDRQLRGYFSWRTKVRRGIIERTQLSFAFVYIYELINQIGVSSPEEGFNTLKNFWTVYREIDSRISRYVKLWLKDYVVYNNLDKSLLEGISDAEFDVNLLTLLDYKAHSADDVFSALNSMSKYNLENSRLFTQCSEDVKNVVYEVYSMLSDHYNNGKISLYERFFGKIYTSSYIMFKSAVFFHQANRNDIEYEINDIFKFGCKGGNWTCTRFFPYRGKNRYVGELFKNIDFYMRQKTNFKPKLQVKKTNELFQDIIIGAINRCQEYKKRAALPRIEIDVSKLQNIRDAALEIQNKLTVEENEEADANEIVSEEAKQETDIGLSDVEQEFLKCLLFNKSYDGLIKSKGLMLSALIDSINEHFFDMFADTVIVDEEDKPVLVKDYVDALKGIIVE